MWDQQFEDLLRQFLPFLGADEVLEADSTLRDLGLDSLGTVELLGSLEDRYDVRFLDEALNAETFATPASLWDILSSLSSASV
jgi:acyl carrier protein